MGIWTEVGLTLTTKCTSKKSLSSWNARNTKRTQKACQTHTKFTLFWVGTVFNFHVWHRICLGTTFQDIVSLRCTFHVYWQVFARYYKLTKLNVEQFYFHWNVLYSIIISTCTRLNFTRLIPLFHYYYYFTLFVNNNMLS